MQRDVTVLEIIIIWSLAYFIGRALGVAIARTVNEYLVEFKKVTKNGIGCSTLSW